MTPLEHKKDSTSTEKELFSASLVFTILEGLEQTYLRQKLNGNGAELNRNQT